MLKYLRHHLSTAALCLIPTIAQAQTYTPSNRAPVADGTMNTQVSGGGNNFNITGGQARGQTLFHSFTDFSVPTNGAANFINPTNPRDIITRVTGNNFSDINGLINSNGANFFLINPNGVTFGTNAQLNVGRAFMATTADGINLVDGTGRTFTFGKSSTGDAPLLSVNSNVLFNPSQLIMGGGNGQINNFGTLQANNSGQYISLIGGNVNFNGGQIFAPSANVELGGLSQAGTVEFSIDRGVQLPGNVTRGNVSLVTVGAVPSIIDVRAGGGGNVNIFASDIALTGTGSYIATGIFPGLGSPTAQAGDIKLDATGKIAISEGKIFNQVAAGGIGNGGNIEITTGDLAVTNGAQLVANTRGRGDAGSVKITATGDILFDGRKDGFSSGAFSTVEQDAVGKGGGIEITTGDLAATNGAQLTASTFGTGDAGSVKISAAGDILFDGRKDAFNSGAFSTVEQGAVGKGGKIEITTNNLSVTNNAKVNTNTYGQGDAGKISIDAKRKLAVTTQGNIFSGVESTAVGNSQGIDIKSGEIELINGGTIQADTLQSQQVNGTGNAGSIKIVANGNVTIVGNIDPTVSQYTSGISSSSTGKGSAGKITINNQGHKISLFNQGAIFNAIALTATGNSQGIKIDTSDLTLKNSSFIATAVISATGEAGDIKIVSAENIDISNNSGISSGNFGLGKAGNISIESNKLKLNKSQIFTNGFSVSGGSLNFDVRDLLLLRDNSRITTDSGSGERNGDGGNIAISSPLIIALPGNNDITANAYFGNGGRVNITSQGLFGIGFRPKGQESNFTNDITASSTFGQNGTVNISIPGTDPGKDSNQLPNVPTDASNQISQTCGASTRANKLTVTGRGGLPPNADDPLTSDVVWQDTRDTNSQPAVISAPNNFATLPPPAVGWVFDGKGKVTLIAAGTQTQTGTSVACPQG